MFEVWSEEDGWHFRLNDSDGHLLASSVKTYPTKNDALADIAIARKFAMDAGIDDQTEGEGDEQ